jgi:hypothetical protein
MIISTGIRRYSATEILRNTIGIEITTNAIDRKIIVLRRIEYASSSILRVDINITKTLARHAMSRMDAADRLTN